MSFCAGTEISEIDIAGFVASDRNDFESGHNCAGGIGAVSGGRDEANVAMSFTTTCMISVNDEKAGIFALRAGIGLERDSGEAGDFGEPIFELLEESLVTASLLQRSKGMKLAEFGPAYRKHFGAGVELHRAGAKRDH